MTKILVAEDERDIRELIAFTLRFAGFDVVLARNGEEAVELAAVEHPDMIMLDVRMPKLTGYEACRQIKNDPAFAETPVVFLSAKGQDAEIQMGLEMGAEEYILKPFVPDGLVAQVKGVLERNKK
ncbi:MAG: response regulator [Anaerolineae bacterium]|nr:response regulator [Anaerolineae bacterium]